MELNVLARKIETTLTNPLGAARVASYHWAQWSGRRELVRIGLENEVKVCEEKCRVAGALPPNYTELKNLYMDVRQRRPKVVFEFGSGLSTHFLAAALRDNTAAGCSKGMLYSFEHHEQWLNHTEHWLNDDLRDFVDLIYAPTRVVEMHGRQVFLYDNIPANLTPEMIYLDGPTLNPEVRASADILELEERLEPGFLLVIDGRRDNAKFLEEHWRNRYRRTVRTGFLGGAYIQRCYEMVAKGAYTP